VVGAFGARGFSDRPWRRCDWPLLAAVVGVLALSLPTIYSASLVAEGGPDPFRFALRQAIWIGLAAVALLLATSLDYHLFPDLSRWVYALSLVGLALVLVCGREVNGARAWFHFGPLALQPSEPAKIAVLLALARWFAARAAPGPEPRGLAGSAGVLAPPVLLILAQPDLGTTLTFLVMWVAMLWWSGARVWQLGVLALVGVGLVAVLWRCDVLADYQKNRITVLVNPDIDPRGVGYNLRQSLVAVGSGGLTGKGWLQGTQTHLRFLPERHTDFIFAVLCEEWGLAGAALLLALYGLLFWRLWGLISIADDPFGRLLVVGCAAVLLFHVVLNIGMVLGLLPITGLPLPFFSYGGSNLLTSAVLVGIALNVGMRRRALGA